jgi:Acetoacetate decarboxylase (ADC)
MLTGSAPLYELVEHAATMPGFDTDALTLPNVEVFQAMFEMHIGAREASLPSGLHPTGAPTFIFQVWQCPESPWGPFSLAQGRVGSRSGLRPRGHIQGCVCDNEAASAALRARWGFPVQPGAVTLRHHYDAVDASAAVGGDVVVAIGGRDPEPLGNDDIAYSSSVALAHTPRGLRLVQIEYDVAVTRAERLRPVLEVFNAEGFGMHPTVKPYHPVSASFALGAIELHRLRFVCRPEELAFTGTEPVRD